MSREKVAVAVVGATGLVGAELVEALSARKFPVSTLRLFASWNTAGEKMPFGNDEIKVEPMAADFFKGSDIVFFAAHPMVSRDTAEDAARAGAMVIDASSAFRLMPDVPLVVPEINAEKIADAIKGRRIVASPSAQAVALALVAAPLHCKWGVKRIIATIAHGSTSCGRAGFEEHQNQTVGIFNQADPVPEKFPRQSAFNIFPKVGEFDEAEALAERELGQELPRIIGEDIPLAATSMQAPVFCGLAVSADVELGEYASPESVRELLSSAPGVRVMDDPEKEEYPDTLEAMAVNEVLVGRIRRDPTSDRAIQLWISADNLRKGSAVNMVQIAELIVRVLE